MRADKNQVSRLLKTARGQLDGILKMIEEDRYCIDISTQLSATEALIRKANKEVIRAHMKGCLMDAARDGNVDDKIDELMNVIDKLK
ncbi:transcriptional regulator [bacterium C-53]|nr:transcriptional regulator [Lachnospiraceae bacterium]NBI03037.1 transcriptional regulator [Lachnospiraceae bacterium]RKJ10649.1 transcriptional regulator [bacterium C-53]